MRLLAVVVLYHPGKDLTGNINSYLSQVDRLLLWDKRPGAERNSCLCQVSLIRSVWNIGVAGGM